MNHPSEARIDSTTKVPAHYGLLEAGSALKLEPQMKINGPLLLIMSGTSIDAVDYALCTITDRTVQLEGHFGRLNFHARLRKQQLHACARNDASELGVLHNSITTWAGSMRWALQPGNHFGDREARLVDFTGKRFTTIHPDPTRPLFSWVSQRIWPKNSVCRW